MDIVNDKDTWDNFIDNSSNGLLFHKWDFLKIIEKYTGYRLLTYGVYRGNELFCLFPIYYKKNGNIKMMYSPPQTTLTYVPYMGFVFKSDFDSFKQQKKESYMETITDDLEEEIKKLSINYISIASVPRFIDARSFKWKNYNINNNYTYIINLNRDIDDIWNSFSKECRDCIRKSGKLNNELKEKNDPELFIQIMKERLKNERLTYFQRQDQNYLKDLLEKYPDNFKMYFVYNQGKIIGNKLVIEYRDRTIVWMGAADTNSGYYANEYAHWELIKIAKERGFKEYENWGADVKRLNLFKSKFNPSLELCLTYHKKDRMGAVAYWGYDVISHTPQLDFLRKRVM